MAPWHELLARGMGVAVGAGAVAYGLTSESIVTAIIGAITSSIAALLGVVPTWRQQSMDVAKAQYEQFVKEREALHDEREELLAALRGEIQRLKALVSELEIKLDECEQKSDMLLSKVQDMRQGIYSDTDLEVAQLIAARKKKPAQE